jgi:DNA modification methylase
MKVKILEGNCIEQLKSLPDESVNCCITSPPYWGLRDYGTGTWVGGDSSCSHKRDSKQSDKTQTGHRNLEGAVGDGIYKDVCKRCGAVRKDNQVGLELTPEQYTAKIVSVFREVHRVLKNDGTLWLNLGDSYASYRDGKVTPDTARNGNNGTLVDSGLAKNRMASTFAGTSVKHKDLVGIPWRVAFALQADGWYLRQDIIWHKPNPMPESVRDRCTKAHEYIFLMTKSPHYYFDNEAIKVESKQDWGTRDRTNGKYHNVGTGLQPHSGLTKSYEKANKRSVWSVNVKPYKEAHFATYPAELIEPCVLAGCPIGGTVLDPFGGSGTTAQVAIENGRNAILCELNPEYIKLINKRIAEAQPLLQM